MVGEMVQNSQSLYSFTFSDVIIVYEYIDSHSVMLSLFTNILIRIQQLNLYSGNILMHI